MTDLKYIEDNQFLISMAILMRNTANGAILTEILSIKILMC